MEKTCLTEIIFENSFRDKSLKNIEINYDKIEDILTNALLRKVKEFNDNEPKINYVIYLNEAYLHENTSILNDFIKNYQPLQEINKDEKKQILKAFKKISNKEQCINIINDFNEIIIDLNKSFKSFDNEKEVININNDIITSETKKQDFFIGNIEKEEEEAKDKENEIIINKESLENGEQIKEKEEEEEKSDIENENKIEEIDEENKENIENKIKERINKEITEKERINKEKSTKIIDIIKYKSHSQIGNDNYSNEFNNILNNN